uniref:RCK C-terminal domain-containing protein n=1 Tax=candidate division WOR-3 bacterium TaxID=2052148 RepID=A0A7C4Y6B3_UNCW3
MTGIFLEQLFVLFFILTIGTIIGNLSFKGFSLGSSGVLFVALIFGHFGMTISKEIMDIGLILFVYSVGLSAAPGFIKSFKKDGLKYIIITLIITLTGGFISVISGFIFKLSPSIVAGLYTGALTCTPAFAAVLDIVRQQVPEGISLVSVGYGVAYPYGMIGVVFIVNLISKILKKSIKNEEEKWREENKNLYPPIKVKYFKVTNPNCDGKKIIDITPKKLLDITISRVKHNDEVKLAGPDTILYLGDTLVAVGVEDDLEKLKFIIGDEGEPFEIERDPNIVSQDVEVIDSRIINKPLYMLGFWERYGVRLTRIRRQGFELFPSSNMKLEMGDIIRIVGERKDVEKFVKEMRGSSKRLNETSMGTFLGGILIGIIIGFIPLRITGDITIRLGMAGGVFISSLFIGYFKKIGRFYLYVPVAARSFSREIGILLFLAGAGTNAGTKIVEILKSQGIILFSVGLIITTISCVVGIFIMLKIFRMGLLESLGSLTASMTNPPALAASSELTTTDIPTISYAATYPAGLILKIIIAQIIFQIIS